MRDSISSWQKNLAQGFTSANDLLAFLDLPMALANEEAAKTFRTRVPRGFAKRMERGNIHDPLLRQVLAVSDELSLSDQFVNDPLEEIETNIRPGLIHKYKGRVLLIGAGSCAVHCRYCFRRHFPYETNNPGRQGWQSTIDYIYQDPTIHEVILSGGDPLLLSDNALKSLVEQLQQITHVHTLRFHTRIPIVLPERINDAFIKLLAESRLKKVMVFHTNHPNELDETVLEASNKLRNIGFHLLNQSVLLAGVNDDAQILAKLSERLFAFGVLPYYLHLLDKVKGAMHFDVPSNEALAIFRTLQTLLPGYLVPRLTREEPGQRSKTLII